MAFGAHFIGEKLSHYYLDHRVLAASNLAVREKFDLDIVQAISDPYREAVDFGVKVTFPEDGLPMRQAPLLASPEQLVRLRVPVPESGRRMSDRFEGVQALRQQVGNEAPVMGWVEGALAEANVRRGSRDPGWGTPYENLKAQANVLKRFGSQAEAGIYA